MTLILELFGWFLFEFLLIIPGGFIKWVLLKLRGKDVAFKECFTGKKRFSEKQVGQSYIVGFLAMILVALLIKVV